MSLVSTCVRFGSFELDLHSGELRKNGLKVHIADQPLQVLILLLNHPGSLVTREELQRQLWSTNTFVDFEHGLNAAVKRLREILGDTAENPQFIETIPRHGYRFLVPVNVIPPTNARPTPPEQEAHSRPSEQNRRWLLGVLALTVLIVAFSTPSIRTSVEHWFTPRREPIRSLAVLPLVNLSNDPKQDYLSEGLTEALITELGRVRSLRVISRQSVTSYKGTTKTVGQIARELHVDAIVEGAALQDGDKVRVSAQLIRVAPEEHVWAQSYERRIDDVLALQNEVALAIVGAISANLAAEESGRLAHVHAVVPAAQDAYLRGVYEAGKFTPAGFSSAVEQFQQAISLDPNYPLPHLALADVYLNLPYSSSVAAAKSFPMAQAEASKALELDHNLAEAHSALAWVHAAYSWDWVQAEKEFQRAVELNPSSASAHRRYSCFLTWLGRYDEALAEAKRARELDPLNVLSYRVVGMVLYCNHQYDPALQEWSNAMKIDAKNPAVNGDVGRAYLQKGMYQEAITQFETARSLAGGETGASATGGGWLAHAYGAAGRRDDALKILDALKQRSQQTYVSPLNIAIIYLGLGDRDRTFEWLEVGYAMRDADMVLLNVNPVWDPLRKDPRFTALLRRMNFP
jgi:TolB-like protein/DNA-binding winged helix-turn-helix (wHTH) protein/Tfp pilus assembly protein PilF